MSSISIIIPTLGRPTLTRAVDSALASMGPYDELIVVSDGSFKAARQIMTDKFDERTLFVETRPTRSWGTAQYDLGMKLATKRWIAFLPDDDYFLTYSCEYIRNGVGLPGGPNEPWGVHVFGCSMLHWPGQPVLKNSKVAGQVTGNQIVVPNDDLLKHYVKWSDSSRQIFDHDYLMAALRHFNQEDPYYHDEVICVADQYNAGRLF